MGKQPMSRNGKLVKVLVGMIVSIATALLIYQVQRGFAKVDKGFEKLDNMAMTLAAYTAIVDSGKNERLNYQDKNDQAHNQILGKLDSLVTRREFDLRGVIVDSKFLDVNAEIKEVQARITKIEAQLLTLDTRFLTLDSQLQDLKNRVAELRSR